MGTPVQTARSDALMEYVDSTPLLIRRLDDWKLAVNTVYNYVHGYYNLHSQLGPLLERISRSLAEGPEFPDMLGGPSGSANFAANAAEEVSSGRMSLARVFPLLRSQSAAITQRNDATMQMIKTTILPSINQLNSDIEKQYRHLKANGQKGIKDIEKARESTLRLVEHLGRVTSSYGVTVLDIKDDPYIIRRRILGAVDEQVMKENVQSEAALAMQHGFASLEERVLTVLRAAIENLEKAIGVTADAQMQASRSVTSAFQTINLKEEWVFFNRSNAASLVPEKSYKRDPKLVEFANKNHNSTKPLICGIIQRKTTMLKNYVPAFFVVTPAGYLHQFKNEDFNQSPTPEWSLYLPECQLGGLPARHTNDLTFQLVGKDVGKMITKRHKFTFKVSSYDDLENWYHTIARVAGKGSGPLTELPGGDSTAQSSVSTPSLQQQQDPVAAGADAVPSSSEHPSHEGPPRETVRSVSSTGPDAQRLYGYDTPVHNNRQGSSEFSPADYGSPGIRTVSTQRQATQSSYGSTEPASWDPQAAYARTASRQVSGGACSVNLDSNHPSSEFNQWDQSSAKQWQSQMTQRGPPVQAYHERPRDTSYGSQPSRGSSEHTNSSLYGVLPKQVQAQAQTQAHQEVPYERQNVGPMAASQTHYNAPNAELFHHQSHESYASNPPADTDHYAAAFQNHASPHIQYQERDTYAEPRSPQAIQTISHELDEFQDSQDRDGLFKSF